MLTIIPTLAPLNPEETIITGTTQLIDRVSIGCKASGRPKADIMWSVMLPGREAEAVDLSDPDTNATSARQGQSVLTVRFNNMQTSCFTYICTASNGGPDTPQGSATVCPQRTYVADRTAAALARVYVVDSVNLTQVLTSKLEAP